MVIEEKTKETDYADMASRHDDPVDTLTLKETPFDKTHDVPNLGNVITTVAPPDILILVDEITNVTEETCLAVGK